MGSLEQLIIRQELVQRREEGCSCTENKISDLATRTCKVAKNIVLEDRSISATADAAQDSIVGSWSLEWSWQGGKTNYEMRVDSDLTGTLNGSNDGASYSLSDVKSAGNDVQFSYVIDKGGWELELRFGGVIAGDTIKGDLFSPVGKMNVTGTRIT